MMTALRYHGLTHAPRHTAWLAVVLFCLFSGIPVAAESVDGAGKTPDIRDIPVNNAAGSKDTGQHNAQEQHNNGQPNGLSGANPREKIYISADQMNLNLTTGKSVYTGNVQIRQGKLILTGDTVTLTHTENALKTLTITGKPARYNHVTEDGEPIMAESDTMVYTAARSRLELTSNARLEQPDHLVTSQKIVFDTLRKIVMAGEESAGEPDAERKRVNITLTPKPEEANKKSK